MVRRTKEDAEKTREMLIDAAEVVFDRKGVAAASLEEIARSAGVTRGAIYWHFANKQDLFEAMHERVKLPLDTRFEQALRDDDPLGALKELCIFVLQNLARDARMRRVFAIVQFKCEQVDQNQRIVERMQQRRHEVMQKFIRVFTLAKEQGRMDAGRCPEMSALALHAFICGLVTDYLSGECRYDIEVMAQPLVDMMFSGITMQAQQPA